MPPLELETALPLPLAVWVLPVLPPPLPPLVELELVAVAPPPPLELAPDEWLDPFDVPPDDPHPADATDPPAASAARNVSASRGERVGPRGNEGFEEKVMLEK